MGFPTVKLGTTDRLETDLVMLSCFERGAPDAGRLGGRLASALRRLEGDSAWRAVPKQVGRASTGGARPRLIEVDGLGPASKLDDLGLAQWISRALARSRQEGRRAVTLILPAVEAARGPAALRILLQILDSGYRFDRFRVRPKRPALRTIHLFPPSGEDEVYARALPLARHIANGLRWARDLGNTPPNIATPSWMAAQAQALADERGLSCTVLEAPALGEMGMGGILAVGGGSANPPRLVRLEWGEGERVVALVGKGVTFDTGGISIKPAASMEEMKFDKCGACAVLGIVRALCEAGVQGHYRAYLPFVENMPGGSSYRPSDIVRCYNGKRVEIVNTDAEGRMILADALAWAAAEKAETILELSTLTGATVVALGNEGAALYTPNDELAMELLQAAESSGERLWRMPLWQGFSEQMEGNHADLQNLGSRWGSANQAAAFLANFVGRTQRWAHLDIAGTAYTTQRETGQSGATGYGVSLAVSWLLRRTGLL